MTVAVNEVVNQNDIQESTYAAARKSVINAQRKIYTSVNNSMVLAYWEIGEQIYKACGDNDRAEYGKIYYNTFLQDYLRNSEKVFLFRI